MPHDRDDNAIDPAKPEMLSYAGPPRPGEEVPKKRLIPVGQFIFVLAIVVVLVGMLLPSLSKNHVRSPSLQCIGNMRQVFLAMRLYAVENRDVYPLRLADLAKYVGGGSGASFVCPESKTQPSPGPATGQLADDLANPAKACCSYVLVVPGMNERGMKPNTILLHEQPGNHKNGMTNFAYADGSVRSLDAKEAKWAISELAAGFNPPRAINSVPATAPSR